MHRAKRHALVGRSRLGSGFGPAKAQGGVRTSSSGRHGAQAPGGSRDRGCNGHRILRRVPAGGRHPGSSRAIACHEAVVTAVSAAPSRKTASARRRKRRPARGRGDRDVRGSVVKGSVGRRRPRSDPAEMLVTRLERAWSSAIRRSGLGWREPPGPLVKPHGSQNPWGAHAAQAAAASQERARCGYTPTRSGGRSRSDASRVLPNPESQDLGVDQQGASRKEARSTV